MKKIEVIGVWKWRKLLPEGDPWIDSNGWWV